MKNLAKRLLVLVVAFSFLTGLLSSSIVHGEKGQTDIRTSRSPEKSEGWYSIPFEKAEDRAQMITPRITGIPEDELPEYADTDIVRVSILLEGEAAADLFPLDNIVQNEEAAAYRAILEKKQKEAEKRISEEVLEGAELDVIWNLTLITNVISARVEFGKIPAIKKLDGIKNVILEQFSSLDTVVSGEPLKPQMFASPTMTGTYQVWAEGYTGAGTVISVVDTGIDTEHISFDSDAFEYALSSLEKEVDLFTLEDITAVFDQLNAKKKNPDITPEDTYINAKIPFGFNYADNNTDVSHLHDNGGDHGSHVAGIAAANRFVPDGDGGYAPAADTVKVQGQAPDAQILALKALGKNGSGSNSDIIAALEDAIVLGSHVINLSIGEYEGAFTTDEEFDDVFMNLNQTGTVVAVSAGNYNSWTSGLLWKMLYAEDKNLSMVTEPASLTNSLSVASVDTIGNQGPSIIAFGKPVVYRDNGGSGYRRFETLKGEYEFIAIDNFGGDEEFAAVADVLEGKIALCNRGGIMFYEKANAAIKYGAVALIVCNNQPGMIGMTFNNNYEYTNPAVIISQKDAKHIFKNAEPVADIKTGDILYYRGTLNLTHETVSYPDESGYYSMSSFSSYGLSGKLTLKPEISAPGGSIYSVYGASYEENKEGGLVLKNETHDVYGYMSGTSMAAPQIAGISSLLFQYIRENDLENRTGMSSRRLITSLLTGTASPLIDESSGSYYSLLRQGGGFVDARAALKTHTYITMGEDATESFADGKVKAEIGEVSRDKKDFTFTFDVNNFSNQDSSYLLTADFFTQDYKLDVEFDYEGKPKTDDEGKEIPCLYLSEKTVFLSAEKKWKAGGESLTDENGIVKITVPAEGKITVTISVKLLNIDDYDINGAYIEGFVYVTEDEEEGVSSSIPVIGYYGNWSDFAMFDYGTAADYYKNTVDRTPYTAVVLGDSAGAETGFYFVDKNGAEYAGIGNPYIDDEVYHPERDAIGFNTILSNVTFSLIRPAGASEVVILDEQGNRLFQKDIGRLNNAWYHDELDQWYNVNQSKPVVFSPKDLEDGSFIYVIFRACPEYHTYKEVIEWDQFPERSRLTHSYVVDGTNPEILSVEAHYNSEKEVFDAIRVTAADNQYIATSVLSDEYGEIIGDFGSDEQAAAGDYYVRIFDLSDYYEDLSLVPDHLLVSVYDYATNSSDYYLNLNNEEQSEDVNIAFDDDMVLLIPDAIHTLDYYLTPWGKSSEIIWTSDDEKVAMVDGSGTITAISGGETIVKGSLKEAPYNFARIRVKVIDIQKELWGIYRDPGALCWFSSFNVMSFGEAVKRTGSDIGFPVTGVCYDQYGNLWGTSYDNETKRSELYAVNEETLEMTLVGALDSGAVDIAPAPGISESSGKLLISCVTESFITWIDTETGKTVFSLDCSEGLDENCLIALAYCGSYYDENLAGPVDQYYLVTGDGALLKAEFAVKNGNLLQILPFMERGIICEPVDINYSHSLYADTDGNLFFSRTNVFGNYSQLIFCDLSDMENIRTVTTGYMDVYECLTGGLFEKNDSIAFDYNSMTEGDITDTGFVFEITPENNVRIIRYTGKETDITIPARLSGRPVAAIGPKAFYNLKDLKEILIPETVVTIGDNAFGYEDSDTGSPSKIHGFLIKGYAGTNAEEYARLNGFEFRDISASENPPVTEENNPPTGDNTGLRILFVTIFAALALTVTIKGKKASGENVKHFRKCPKIF